VEITRRIRAKLFAALVAAGSAVPALGQSPGDAVNVDPPRAPSGVMPSPLSLLPDAATAAAYRFNGTTGPAPGQLEKMPTGDAAPAASLGPLPAINAATGPALPPPPPMMPAGPAMPPMSPGPPPPPVVPAPLWRWYGYGGVKPTDIIEPLPMATPTPAKANTPVTTPAASNQTVPEWRPALPGPAPSSAVDAMPMPPMPAVPTSAAPAAPTMEQAAAANRMPGVIITASAVGAAWGDPAATLDAPRPAGSYVPNAVSPTFILPASYTVPMSYSRPPAQPVSFAPVRLSIERVCVNRGRDLELIPQSQSTLLVRLKVRQVADAQYLANVISKLPELAPYKVLFEMQVAG
jgi:hypothetical protein